MTELAETLKAAEGNIAAARVARHEVERNAINVLARSLANELRAIADRDFAQDAYLREKASQFGEHMAAAVGFGEDNGHDPEQHRVWALGALSSYEGRAAQLERGE